MSNRQNRAGKQTSLSSSTLHIPPQVFELKFQNFPLPRISPLLSPDLLLVLYFNCDTQLNGANLGNDMKYYAENILLHFMDGTMKIYLFESLQNM